METKGGLELVAEGEMIGLAAGWRQSTKAQGSSQRSVRAVNL